MSLFHFYHNVAKCSAYGNLKKDNLPSSPFWYLIKWKKLGNQSSAVRSFNNHEIFMKSLISFSSILVKKDEGVIFFIEMSFLIWKPVFKSKTGKKHCDFTVI